MPDRYANLRRIRTLDPRRDYLDIYQTMVRYEFPWDSKLGLNLAFNRSFSLPTIAAVHVRSGELLRHTRKRVDDTGLLMYEMLLHGFDHPRGRDAVRRTNQIHRHYDIAADDYRYVLGCLVVVPIRWLQRYGWRQPCCHERTAVYHYYRELGSRMGITDIPGSYPEFAAWFDEHDRRHLRYSADAAAIERATRALLRGRVPRLLATLFATPSLAVRAGLHAALRLRATLLRRAGRPRRTPLFADGISTPTYPHGYEISQLGPAGH
jgi:hypothetical protein